MQSKLSSLPIPCILISALTACLKVLALGPLALGHMALGPLAWGHMALGPLAWGHMALPLNV